MPLRRLPLLVLALIAGGGTAAAIPAFGSGADHAVTASDSPSRHWSPTTITIADGDSVTFSYPNGNTMHNVHFTDLPAGDADANPAPAQPAGPGWTATFVFTTDGTFHYHCDLHHAMTGVVVVGDGGPTTTTDPTTTTVPTTTSTTPTATTTVPTTTTTTPTGTTPTDTTPTDTTPAPDATPPSGTRVTVVRGRLRLKLSEPARLAGTLTRGGHRVARLRARLAKGTRSVRLPGHLRRGLYRVRFTLTDAAGNRTPAKTVSFRVR